MDRGSVVLLQRDSTRVFLPVRDLPDESPYALAEDADGGMWISYRTGSIRRIANGVVTSFDARDGLPTTPGLCGLAADTKGRIWYAQGRDFGIYRNGRFERLGSIP